MFVSSHRECNHLICGCLFSLRQSIGVTPQISGHHSCLSKKRKEEMQRNGMESHRTVHVWMFWSTVTAGTPASCRRVQWILDQLLGSERKLLPFLGAGYTPWSKLADKVHGRLWYTVEDKAHHQSYKRCSLIKNSVVNTQPALCEKLG